MSPSMLNILNFPTRQKHLPLKFKLLPLVNMSHGKQIGLQAPKAGNAEAQRETPQVTEVSFEKINFTVSEVVGPAQPLQKEIKSLSTFNFKQTPSGVHPFTYQVMKKADAIWVYSVATTNQAESRTLLSHVRKQDSGEWLVWSNHTLPEWECHNKRTKKLASVPSISLTDFVSIEQNG